MTKEIKRTCSTCKWWDRDWGRDNVASCDRPFVDVKTNDEMVFEVVVDVSDDTGLDEKLLTSGNFGCLLHEPRKRIKDIPDSMYIVETEDYGAEYHGGYLVITRKSDGKATVVKIKKNGREATLRMFLSDVKEYGAERAFKTYIKLRGREWE